MSETHSLAGSFLLALPDQSGDYFDGALVLIGKHDREGAWGLIVNRPTGISLTNVLGNIGIPQRVAELPDTVYTGGPVAPNAGFCLHSPDRRYSVCDSITPTLTVTRSRDVLETIARGEGPKKRLFFLGSCGWAPGQLESELSRNVWLSLPGNDEILFEVPPEARYDQALGQLGLTLEQLKHAGGTVGHA